MVLQGNSAGSMLRCAPWSPGTKLGAADLHVAAAALALPSGQPPSLRQPRFYCGTAASTVLQMQQMRRAPGAMIGEKVRGAQRFANRGAYARVVHPPEPNSRPSGTEP
jgi:hypothetical protein